MDLQPHCLDVTFVAHADVSPLSASHLRTLRLGMNAGSMAGAKVEAAKQHPGGNGLSAQATLPQWFHKQENFEPLLPVC